MPNKGLVGDAHPTWLALALGIAALAVAHADACSVPVFRYALERFEADPYEFVVFHRGPLAPDVKPSIDALAKLAEDDNSPIHIRMRLVDLAAPADPAKKLEWTPPADASLPWVAVVPSAAEGWSPIWSGALRGEDLRALIDSPARREFARRLLKGDSAVFVLLESGDKKADEAAASLLAATLPKLEKSLQLPVDDGSGQLRSEVPLRIAFSVFRLGRNDPAERYLVKILLGMGEKAAGGEKATKVAGPMVFPIFGRGRVLTALAGEGISADALEEVGDFLCGGCTCSVKGQLPGGDLLMAADWEALLEGRVVREDPPGLQGLGPLAQAASLAVKPPAASAASPVQTRLTGPPDPAAEPSAPPVESHSGVFFWSLLVTLTGSALLIALGSLYVTNMRREPRG